MAEKLIDYAGIRDAIAATLRTVEGLTVEVEWHGEMPLERLPCALVYMTRRLAPERDQRLSAGQITYFQIIFPVWVMHYSLSSAKEACDLRDRVLAKVEVALMRNRSLGGLVRGSWIEPGEVLSGHDPKKNAFSAAIETRVVVPDYTATM